MTATRAGLTQPINVVFDGPPSPDGPRFIDVETDDGRSLMAGEWVERPDGRWVLRIAELPAAPTEDDQPRAGVIEGLRLLTVLMDADPQLADAAVTGIDLWFGPEDRDRFLALYGQLGDTAVTRHSTGSQTYALRAVGQLRGLRVALYGDPRSICPDGTLDGKLVEVRP